MGQIFSFISADINYTSSKLSMMLSVLSLCSQDWVHYFFLRNNKALNSSNDWWLLVCCHLRSWNEWRPTCGERWGEPLWPVPWQLSLRADGPGLCSSCSVVAFSAPLLLWPQVFIEKPLHPPRGWHSYAALWTQKVGYAAHDLLGSPFWLAHLVTPRKCLDPIALPKSSFGFSVISYRKIQMNFLINAIISTRLRYGAPLLLLLTSLKEKHSVCFGNFFSL